MSELLYKFSFDAVKFNKEMALCVVVVWILVLSCAISSILGQQFSRKERIFWFLVIIGVPLMGLLSYLPFAIRKENYPGLFNTKRKR